MAYTPVPTVNTGDLWTAANQNTYLKDNMAAGVPDIFTTKGDIAVATGADAASRLGVGSNGQYLIADSSQATGLKYVTQINGIHLTNASWNNSTKNAGTYTITLNTFNGSIPSSGVKAVWITAKCTWATANSTEELYIKGNDGTLGYQLEVIPQVAGRAIYGTGLICVPSNQQIVVGIAVNMSELYLFVEGYML